MSAPASMSSRVPAADTTLPATTGTRGSRARTARSASIILSWWPWAVSMTRTSAPVVEHLGGLGRDVAVDADGSSHAQSPVVVDGRSVEAGADRTAPGEDADELAVLRDDGSDLAARRGQPLEGLLRVEGVGQHDHVLVHDVVHLRVAVDAGQVLLADDADGLRAVHDDRDAVGTLADEHERLARRHVPLEGDRRVVDEVALLDPADDVADDLDGDVLGDDGDAAPARDRLGHATPGDGGHVGHDERDRGAGPVDRREVDVEAARHGRAAGHHEDVVVGEVELGLETVEELHGHQL